MTLRDRALIAVFAVLFVATSVFALAPSLTSSPGAQPSALASLSAERPYVEGMLGHATNASPFGARSAGDRALVALLFRGLVRLGPDETIVGDLASSWETDPSGGQWTFHLRPGMRWQDGLPITADDVVFTIQALADPSYTGPGGESWREVTATAPDPLTVVLKLATPLGGFLQAATQAIAPKHLLGNVPPASLADDDFGLHPVGSGPFELTSLDEQHAVLKAVAAPPSAPVASAALGGPTPPAPDESLVPETVFPTPYLSGIEFRYFDDPAALQAAWNAGQLDGASELSPSDAAALAATPGSRALRYPSSTLLAVVLNLRASPSTFHDAAVRRALLEAVDRQAILAAPLLGFGSTASSLIPPWAPEFNAKASPDVPYDPSAAVAALTNAGWKRTAMSWIPKGSTTPLQITLLSADDASNPIADATAEAVAVAWRAIGLDVIHDTVPAADLISGPLSSGEFQAAVLPLVIGLDPDVYPLLASSQTRTGGSNVSGLQDSGLDKLLAAARAPGPAAQRLAAYAALEQNLSSSLWILPLDFRDDVVVVRNTLTGPTPRPVGDPGDRFWDVLTWRLADSPAPS